MARTTEKARTLLRLHAVKQRWEVNHRRSKIREQPRIDDDSENEELSSNDEWESNNDDHSENVTPQYLPTISPVEVDQSGRGDKRSGIRQYRAQQGGPPSCPHGGVCTAGTTSSAPTRELSAHTAGATTQRWTPGAGLNGAGPGPGLRPHHDPSGRK